jgi:site-specific recombinase XerD
LITRVKQHNRYRLKSLVKENGLTLETVRLFRVAAYIEQMPGFNPTIKQKLAAIRMLYDFLVIRQLVPVNPTASARGTKYVVKRGKTPVWSREDAKKLLESETMVRSVVMRPCSSNEAGL